jgi:HlyD family secretion protein
MKNIFIALLLILFGCTRKEEKTYPTVGPISESVYASGIIKSKNQYEAFVTINGNIDQIFVAEGDTIKKGRAILSIANRAQELNRENAKLSAEFADINANQGKLNDATLHPSGGEKNRVAICLCPAFPAVLCL